MNNFNLEKINRFLKSNTTSFSLLIQGITTIILGILLMFFQTFFFSAVVQIVFAYFSLIILLNLLEVVFSITQGIKKLFLSVTKAILSFLVVAFLGWNIDSILVVLPWMLSAWACLVGFANMVSFFQYRHEKSTAPIRYLIAAVINLGFGIPILFNIMEKAQIGYWVFGLYLILFGFSILLDCVASATPDRLKNQLKSRVRITLPPFFTALIPIKILNSINEYLQDDTHQEVDFSLVKDVTPPNVEVFIHVSQSMFGSMGHVDLAVENRVISFGGYDLEKMKLDGAIGVGVLFEHFQKDAYIRFCQEQSQKTLFGFGLVLKPEEIQKILDKLEEIKANTYQWQCKAQVAQEMGESTEKFDDYASLLYKETGATFYKFKKGNFKYYWVLGTNCVKMADTLLCASGLDTLMTGIVTPGTYYNYLNREFMRDGSRVVSRKVYHK